MATLPSFTHGATAYRHRKCRCERCRAGHATQQARGGQTRAAKLAEDPTLAPHGVYTTYDNWSCRCEPCTEANKQKCRQEYERRKAATS